MATLFDDLIPLMPELNAIAGELGANQFEVTVKWSNVSSKQSYLRGKGAVSEGELDVLENGQNPQVEFMRQESLALGLDETAIIRVGPITPKHSSGGYTPADLKAGGNSAVWYNINGPGFTNSRYVFQSLDTSDPLGYYLYLKRA